MTMITVMHPDLMTIITVMSSDLMVDIARVQVMQLLGQPSTLEFSRRIEAVERVTERLVHILVHFQGRTMSNHECQKLADKAMRSLRNLEAAHATWRHESRRVHNSTKENPWAVNRVI